MACIWNVFRSESRRRWASWLALALLVALVGGTVLAGVSAARRTSSAFPNFVQRYGYDVGVFSTIGTVGNLAEMHDVRSTSTSTVFISGNVTVNGQFLPAGDLALLSLPSRRWNQTVKLIDGRLPVGPDEVLAGFSMEQQYGLHLGSVIRVPLYAASQRTIVLSSNGTPTPHGPIVDFHVVGFEASMLDFPSSSPSYSLYTSPAFGRSLGRHVVTFLFSPVRLIHPAQELQRFTYAVNHIPQQPPNFVYPESMDAQVAAIEGSIHPQAVGWWLFALFAALAGVALVGQALSRQSIVERESYPTLSALGLRPGQLFGLGMVRAAAIGLVGMLGALVLAVAVSPFTPVGEARAAEPATGFLFDGLVFGLGAVAIVAVVLLLAVYPSWRASQVRAVAIREDRLVVHGSSRVAGALALLGAPPSMLVGTRHALERGRGRASIPVATALVGMIVAVAALVATTVFGASLSNLLATPRLYGQAWQVDLGNMSHQQILDLASKLANDPAARRFTYGVNGKVVDVNGVNAQAAIVVAAKGPMVFSLIDGSYPRGSDEVLLGTQTLASAHASVGSKVSLSVIGPSGASHTSTFVVSGTMVFPPSLSAGGLGVGAVVTIGGAENAVCGTGPAAASCVAGLLRKIYLPGNENWGGAITVAPGPAGRALVAELDRKLAPYLTVLTVPTNLVNFGQAVNFPALLGITLALFGAATLAHLLFVTVTRRRREIALLKVLGFVRRQVAQAVCWQATTVAIVGVVVGVPVGIAAGNLTWRAYASNVGAVPVGVIPLGLVLAVVAGVLAFGNLLAFAPAALSSRLHPAEALREA